MSGMTVLYILLIVLIVDALIITAMDGWWHL